MKRTALLLLLALPACATITADSHQELTIATRPGDAQCIGTNKQGSWTLASTPGKLKVERDFSPLTIECKGTAGTASKTLEPHTRGRAYGNILLGGVPAIIDAETGDGYAYEPETLILELQPVAAPSR
jgi:hypothetical protein